MATSTQRVQMTEEFTVAGGGDGVEADAVGLVLLGVDARGKDTIRLALPVGELACGDRAVSTSCTCDENISDTKAACEMK